MSSGPDDVPFSPAVKAAQAHRGSRDMYARKAETRPMHDRVTPDLAGFLGEMTHFYFATASAAGQPTIQHRGGPKGFLKVLDDRHLGFADFAGNRQYISLGNLSENPRACIFLMHYPNRTRIKLWGEAEVIEEDLAELGRMLPLLTDPAYPARPERVIRFRIDAWDINCQQHITPRYTDADIDLAVRGMAERMAALETEVTELRRRLAEAGGG